MAQSWYSQMVKKGKNGMEWSYMITLSKGFLTNLDHLPLYSPFTLNAVKYFSRNGMDIEIAP
jgi:hypothetical protein